VNLFRCRRSSGQWIFISVECVCAGAHTAVSEQKVLYDSDPKSSQRTQTFTGVEPLTTRTTPARQYTATSVAELLRELHKKRRPGEIEVVLVKLTYNSRQDDHLFRIHTVRTNRAEINKRGRSQFDPFHCQVPRGCKILTVWMTGKLKGSSFSPRPEQHVRGPWDTKHTDAKFPRSTFPFLKLHIIRHDEVGK
jgi:hypothetical protein